MQEKVSISINKELLEKVNGIIDNAYIRNKSQAFEKIIREYFTSSTIDSAIMLIGKQNSINKHFLTNNIIELKKVGVNKIIIAAGKNNQKVFSLLGSGQDLGINVIYLKEEPLKGTAGAIKSAKKYLNSHFLVLAGDTLFNFAIDKMIKFHMKNDNLTTMGLTTTELNKSTDNIEIEGDKIVSFGYKSGTKTHITNAGIYIFNPSIFDHLPNEGTLEKGVFPRLSKENKLSAYMLDSKLVKIV